MELPEGIPPRSVGGLVGSDVTLQTPGPIGILWEKHRAGPRGTLRDFAVVKAVEQGSCAAIAGVRPFEVLMSINGMTVAPLEFDAVVETIRQTRPLQLRFAPLDRAWLRAEVVFDAPGPLGLKLEPSAGDPRAHGVRLRKVLPGSAHANSTELSAGMELAAMRVGLAPPIQLNDLPYSDVVRNLKAAARPLTLFFDPGEMEATTQATASTEDRSACSADSTSEDAARQADGEAAGVGELKARAVAAAVADENLKALTMLEDHTEAVLSRLLHVAQTELWRIRHEAAAKHAAHAEALALWQERAERAEAAETAAREAAALALADTRQSNRTPSTRNRDASALEEKCEALQLRMEYYESRLRETDERHQAELSMRDIVLRATELELQRAYGSARTTQNSSADRHAPAGADPADVEPTHTAPVLPSYFRLELERLGENHRQREAEIRSEAAAQLAEERAALDAKHARYEDVVDRAYAQVLSVYEMPKFNQRGPP